MAIKKTGTPIFNNANIINRITDESTDFFKSRVATATQNNLAEIGSTILENPDLKNEFHTQFANKITNTLITSARFKNPFAFYKKELGMGETVEETFVGLVNAKKFDQLDAETTLHKRTKPNIGVMLHMINRDEQYEVTVEDKQLRRAFLSPQGLATYASLVVASPNVSNEVDEYELTKHIIYIAGIEGKIKVIEVADPVDEKTVKSVLKKIKTTASAMSKPSTSKKYNYMGFVNPIEKNKQTLMLDLEFKADVDVDVLSTSFNMGKADFDTKTMEVEDFGGLKNVVAGLMSDDWFKIWTRPLEYESDRNKKGKYTNHFLNAEGIFSCSHFENIVLFVKTPPTLLSIDVVPATVSTVKKTTTQFKVEGTGDGTEDEVLDLGVKWSVNSDISSIDNTGELYIPDEETASTLTVTAVSRNDENISDTGIVTIS